MKFYAHTDGSGEERGWQLLRDHLAGVAQRAAGYAEDFQAGKLAYAAGLLHDLGKYSLEFQRRLKGEKIRVDHSTAGAQEAERIYGKALGRILAYVVAGHHAGLQDYGSLADEASLAARLNKEAIPDCQAYREEQLRWPDLSSFRLPIKPLAGQQGFSLAFFIRMLYSCLVDADFLDTEEFCQPERGAARGKHPPLVPMLQKLDQYLQQMLATVPDTPINRERAAILDQCREKASLPPGLFTLTVPTGGGKTLSSLSFALGHAVRHGLERVIYVIPFTSIIEQNARVFREAVGEEGVLEHHSNFQYPDQEDEDWVTPAAKLRLAAENWDAPLVVTTNVQFFESLFANRSARCRKLHNIARSVVILDEAQMIPTDYLRPCLAALVELVRHYGASVVICTATQPALEGLLPGGLKPVELAPEPERLYETFKRVRVSFLGKLNDADLAARLMELSQVLCIVNTRKHARELFQRIRDLPGSYHLSALMCPVHRSAVLAEIRERLAAGETCRLISTQLIEAGVDVDFPVVYRSAAGIDSLAQAAGRCNREGKRKEGQVYLFQPEAHGLPGGWFKRTATLGEMILRQVSDPLSIQAVKDYFTLLYDIEGEGLDRKGIMSSLEEGCGKLAFPFQKVAAEFRIIESPTEALIIPWDDNCRELLYRAKNSSLLGGFARKFQPYVVQLYPQEFLQLLQSNLVDSIGGIFYYLTDPSFYDPQLGLRGWQDADMEREILIL
jgi:CRISPR-associated endonuclease/helicase Cas3